MPYTAFIFVYLHWFALSRTICFSNAEGGEEKKDFYFFFFLLLDRRVFTHVECNIILQVYKLIDQKEKKGES